MNNQEKVALIKRVVTMQKYFDRIVIPAMPDYYSTINVDFEADRRTLCPLHDEDTPSFRWYPEDNSYYCYGCGKGGDIIYLHQMFMEVLTGKKPLFTDAVAEMYKFFIEGRETEIDKQARKSNQKLVSDEPISSNIELVRYGRKVQEIESELIRRKEIGISSKKKIYSLIDSCNILVTLNKMNATEALEKVCKEYDSIKIITKIHA